MVWYAEQQSTLTRPAEGTMGNSGKEIQLCPICVPTSAGFFIGDTMKTIEEKRKANFIATQKYKKTEKGKVTQRRYHQSEKGRVSGLKSSIRYQAQHPEQRPARQAVNNAVRASKLPHIKTLSCMNCFKQAEIYHHPSYAPERKFDIFPVCRKCHSKIHNRDG